jgi:hypothetical protein
MLYEWQKTSLEQWMTQTGQHQIEGQLEVLVKVKS